jgi:hypothetical protein
MNTTNRRVLLFYSMSLSPSGIHPRLEQLYLKHDLNLCLVRLKLFPTSLSELALSRC